MDMNSLLLNVYAEARKVYDQSSVCDLACYCGTYSLSSKKFDGIRENATKLEGWVKTNHPKAVAHYVIDNKRKSTGAVLHLNFASGADLSDEMRASSDVELGSRLVRCAGGDGKPCGLSILSFPELIYIHGSVGRTEVGKTSMGEVAKSVSMAINDVCGKPVLLDNVSASENQSGNRVISVRFHQLSDLRTFITHESGFKLWGRDTTVEVPNVPDLCLCHGCNERGHKVKDCPKYSGMVVRFVFKKAVSELARQKIASVAKASNVYTGLFAGVKRPNHMVHCIYQSADEVKVGVFEVVKAYDPLLVRAPIMCDVRNKANECYNCGETSHRGNMCPLMHGEMVRPLGNYSARVGSSESKSQAPRPNQLQERPLPQVCFAWSSHGECNREKCPYPHPENRKAEVGTCFDFRDKGVCTFGDRCKYKHVGLSSSPPAAPAAEHKAPEPPAQSASRPPHPSPPEPAPIVSPPSRTSSVSSVVIIRSPPATQEVPPSSLSFLPKPHPKAKLVIDSDGFTTVSPVKKKRARTAAEKQADEKVEDDDGPSQQ